MNLITLLPLFFWLFLHQQRKWSSFLEPPVFITAFWTALIVIHASLGFDVDVSKNSVIIIFLFLLFFCLGYSLSTKTISTSPVKINDKDSFLIISFWVGVISGLSAVIYLIASSKQGLSSLSSINAYLEMTTELTSRRYRGHAEPIISRILTLGHYNSAFLGGLLFAKISRTKWHSNLKFLTPIAVGILITLTLTTRASTLFTLFLWVGGYLATRLALNNFKVSFKLLLGSAVLLILLSSLFIITLQIRYSIPFSNVTLAFEKFRLDFFSFLGPFSIWLNGFLLQETHTLSLGQYSFSGIYDKLGIAERAQGIYIHSAFVSYGHPTNIYTSFRQLLQDFGILGTNLIFLTLGGALRLALFKVRQNIYNGFHLVFLSVFFTSALFSHITCILNYNSIIITFISAALCIEIQKAIHKHYKKTNNTLTPKNTPDITIKNTH
ncbi:MAG: oligosaccharide repeat unit polymerase [Bdellovibrionaceae bacterium]|nr:oligosaccharide repeat unit polymerase [Pseudobdellovibrionaceae bacterium]